MLSRTPIFCRKVAVLGAAGGIGQPLSLLLKASPLIKSLACYDIANVHGVGTDLSHICTPAKVSSYSKDELKQALDGSDVIVIPAGVPRKPGMTRDDLFTTNASIVRHLVSSCASSCPEAMILIISNPVNSTVPIAAEVLKRAGVYDPRKLCGVTTLDVVRAKTFLAAEMKMNPFDINVPVVGGHSGTTIVPLFSQTGLSVSSEAKLKEITHRVQFGGDEVVKAKDGAGSATLSMAYAGAEFTISVLKALRGDKGITECSFVDSSVCPDVPYFSSRVTFGTYGVETVHPIGKISAYEEELLNASKNDLIANINKGIDFVKKD